MPVRKAVGPKKSEPPNKAKSNTGRQSTRHRPKSAVRIQSKTNKSSSNIDLRTSPKEDKSRNRTSVSVDLRMVYSFTPFIEEVIVT